MLDILILFIYLFALLYISISHQRGGNNLSKLSKITDKLKHNKMILVATIFASSIGGGTIFGVSEKLFAENIIHSYALMLGIIIDIMIAWYIIPRLKTHYQSETVGDIMHEYYGRAGRYIGGIAAILVSIGILAAQVSTSGRIFQYILQIDYKIGVICSYIIVIIYTTIGGLQSILFANLLQFFAVVLAIPLITLINLNDLGIEQFWHTIGSDKLSAGDDASLIMHVAAAFLGFMCINLLPTFLQRTTMSMDTPKLQNAIYVKSVIYGFFLIIVTINGLIAYIKYPEYEASLVLSHLIDQTMPPGIQGFVVVGLLAAVMSTADSDLNIVSITLVKDILKPIFKLENSPIMLNLARITNILVGSLSILLALYFDKILDLVMFVTGFWGPVILPALILALFGIVSSWQIFVTSSVIGVSSFLAWHIYCSDSMLPAVFLGTATNMLTLLLGYAIYKQPKIKSPS
jgi:Na+/proline symporter